MATELSSGAISSILEAVPGIATVLRSPIADAIVNLSRAASGIIPFDTKDAHELLRYAVRRGLIRSDEGDRVAAEIDAAMRTHKSPTRASTHASGSRKARKAHGKKSSARSHRPKAKKK